MKIETQLTSTTTAHPISPVKKRTSTVFLATIIHCRLIDAHYYRTTPTTANIPQLSVGGSCCLPNTTSKCIREPCIRIAIPRYSRVGQDAHGPKKIDSRFQPPSLIFGSETLADNYGVLAHYRSMARSLKRSGRFPVVRPVSGLALGTRWALKKAPLPFFRGLKANNLDTVPKVIIIIICNLQIQRGK